MNVCITWIFIRHLSSGNFKFFYMLSPVPNSKMAPSDLCLVAFTSYTAPLTPNQGWPYLTDGLNAEVMVCDVRGWVIKGILSSVWISWPTCSAESQPPCEKDTQIALRRGQALRNWGSWAINCQHPLATHVSEACGPSDNPVQLSSDYNLICLMSSF